MTTAHRTGTVVVGAGQAGLALSRHLTHAGHAHVVLERGRIGERWRSERWDSLVLLSPAWASLLPGQELAGDPDAFPSRRAFVDALEDYAWSFHAPVVEGVTVLRVAGGSGGYAVETDRGLWHAPNVVVATGDCGIPYLPPGAQASPPDVLSLHAARYRSPEQLPTGRVLVVGAGPTGQQLALELVRSGRDVTVAVGRHARLPRRYRGRDIWRWLDTLGDFDVTIDDVVDPVRARRTPSAAVTGANGGEELDLGVLQKAGVDVRGRLLGFAGRHALFADGLADEVGHAEARMRRILARIDEHAARAGRRTGDVEVPPVDVPEHRPSLDLRRAGVGAILWATGYRRSYPWLRVPVLDGDGEIVQRRGVTSAPGLYTLGLRFQRRRGSHFIGGVGADAELLAEAIVAGETSRVARAA